VYELQDAARVINSAITRKNLGLLQRCESLCQILGLQIIRKLKEKQKDGITYRQSGRKRTITFVDGGRVESW